MKTGIGIGIFAFFLVISFAACEEDDDSGGDSYAFEDCIPAKVTGEDRASLHVLLRWIVGEYRDSDGRKNIITCDPADEWDVPPENQYMDESWSIPLRVGVAGVFEVINGRIDIDFLPEKESLINMSLLLDFEVGNVYYRAYRRQIDETSIQWIFLYPDKGMTWTKTEP